jgi:glycosyltransferase involved in cell wall biosynthesis
MFPVPEPPKISVVTPSFNSINTIRETIESVMRQDYPRWEHIVIDGGSTDGTLEVLKQNPHLIWVSEKDQGHYHAMNKGIARATGDLLAILNSDDCYRTQAFRKVADAFVAHPDWDGAFSDVIFKDGEGHEIYRREEAVFDYNVLRFSRICYVNHPTLFVKKSVYDRLGSYRYQDFLNAADYEFFLRLGRDRCRIGHIPEFLVDYRYHEYGQSADLRITRNMAREAAIILKEHGVPTGIVGQLLRFLFRSKRQLQKLLYRRRCDLISGTWFLKRHMREKTTFSSNIGLDKL